MKESPYLSGYSELGKYLNMSESRAKRFAMAAIQNGLSAYELANNRFHFRKDEVDWYVANNKKYSLSSPAVDVGVEKIVNNIIKMFQG